MGHHADGLTFLRHFARRPAVFVSVSDGLEIRARIRAKPSGSRGVISQFTARASWTGTVHYSNIRNQ
jgi:hypothetical protein